MTIKTVCWIIKSYLNHKRDLKVNHIMYIQKKSIRLHYAVITIKDYRPMIELQYILMEQVLERYVK